jgi:hypothetical protein
MSKKFNIITNLTAALLIAIALFIYIMDRRHEAIELNRLQEIVALNKYYPTKEEVESGYITMRNQVFKTYNTVNDSLVITYKFISFHTDNAGSRIKFNRSVYTRFPGKIERVVGYLTLTDSTDKILMTIKDEVRLGAASTDTLYDAVEYNMNRYAAPISKTMQSLGNKFTYEWRTEMILFEDKSIIILENNQ